MQDRSLNTFVSTTTQTNASGISQAEPPLSEHDDERRMAEAIVREAFARQDMLAAERSGRSRRQRLPGWVPPMMRFLAHSLWIVAALNLLIGVLSMVYPLLVRATSVVAMQPIWDFYSVLCPQRPSHTWFIGDVPMAMEQRMVSMYVAFGVAGLLYCARERRPLRAVAGRLPEGLRRPLPLWQMLLGIAPAIIDVAISTVGILPSTGTSRLWTGTLGSLALVAWGYPRYDQMLANTWATVRRIQARDALTVRDAREQMAYAD